MLRSVAPFSPPARGRTQLAASGRSVQCAARRRVQIASPRAPLLEIPMEQLALAADAKPLVRALAVRLHTLLADVEVQRDAEGRQAVENARTDFEFAPGELASGDKTLLDLAAAGQRVRHVGLVGQDLNVLGHRGKQGI